MLKIDKVNTYYGYVHALKDVSLEVGDGEFVALIGANGAGKSTLLKSIIGIQPVKDGTIEFKGSQIERRTPSDIIREGIMIVPEGRRLFPDLTVTENLIIGSRLTGQGKREVELAIEEILETFPALKVRRQQKAGTMSGGEQQMVAIGRALMGKPKLLLLDEPSLGLAPMIVEDVMNILARIHKSGTTILLVEQNVSLALSVAQRAYLLETGSIVLTDTASNLLSSSTIQKSYLGMN